MESATNQYQRIIIGWLVGMLSTIDGLYCDFACSAFKSTIAVILADSSMVITIETRGDSYNHTFIDDHGVYAATLRQLVFNVRAKSDAYIALTNYKYNTSVDTYKVVIGGWLNDKSTILECDQCAPTWTVNNAPLSDIESRPFWLTWYWNTTSSGDTYGVAIKAGTGSVVLENEFMSWFDPQPHDINYVGIATGSASNGTWTFNVVNGGWSNWGQWTSCSVSCGGGLTARDRLCNRPSALYGQPCVGPVRQVNSCNNDTCPGMWSPWTSWMPCSVTCGSGTSTRLRNCTSASMNRPCTGPNSDLQGCSMPACPVDGGWSNWSSWSGCSISCGTGVTTRLRMCNSPSPSLNGQPCPGSELQSGPCATSGCPVNGQWASWSTWSTCTRSCGGGWTVRNRTCDNPTPQNGGADCDVSGLGSLQNQSCNLQNCSLDGSWSQWSLWSACSKTCDTGTKSRYRSCTDPAPQDGGLPCNGSYTDISSCILLYCPVAGGWSGWSLWSACTKTCGNGFSVRQRTCNSPEPQFGGPNCTAGPDGTGPGSVENMSCNPQSCPVDGAWSPWSPWSECSRTCDLGQRVRYRLCNSPMPSNGGQNCSDVDTESMNCKIDDCPPPPPSTWTEWTPWSECSLSCGSGIATRRRLCQSSDATLGSSCEGNSSQVEECFFTFCPVDGNWSSWSAWSPACPICGPGLTSRSRLCNNPVPMFGGQNCTDDSYQEINCNSPSCAVNGGWSIWSEWTPACPVCGPGLASRYRECNSPVPMYGGTNCTEDSYEEINCTSIPCPVNGGWSDWSAWSPMCPVCGPGSTSRRRGCSNPVPLYGGDVCTGDTEQEIDCNSPPCPVAGNWSAWSAWSPSCPVCGPGSTSRNRSCNNPIPSYGGDNCTGNYTEHVNCNSPPCPVDGGWSVWSEWSPACPVCGPGFTRRSRICNNPIPMFGGLNCTENSTQEVSCVTASCPVNGGWSLWSTWSPPCPVCGPRLTSRSRVCNNPVPMYGGKNCTEDSYQEINCTSPPCAVNGGWTSWGTWSSCSVSCEQGVWTRNRSCTNPVPQYNGAPCNGSYNETGPCFVVQCPVNGQWSPWQSWQDCNASCGSGWMLRKRYCNNPPPVYNGLDCGANKTQYQTCNVDCNNKASGKNNVAPVLEAPGAAEIGLVGVGICCALIAAIMLLDLVSIQKHFIFLRKNIHFGWQRWQRLTGATATGQKRKQPSVKRQLAAVQQKEEEDKQQMKDNPSERIRKPIAVYRQPLPPLPPRTDHHLPVSNHAVAVGVQLDASEQQLYADEKRLFSLDTSITKM